MDPSMYRFLVLSTGPFSFCAAFFALAVNPNEGGDDDKDGEGKGGLEYLLNELDDVELVLTPESEKSDDDDVEEDVNGE